MKVPCRRGSGTGMGELSRMDTLTLSIAAVERDTGLSKDTLRVWERRYAFPTPGRDASGERAYSLHDVEKLRVVKRLLDAGHRPGRIVPLSLDELQLLADRTVDQPIRGAESTRDAADVRSNLALVRAHDPEGLRTALSRQLSRLGVGRFVTDVVGPLGAAVGDAWMRGQLEVFEEHACSESLQAVLRRAIAALPESAPGQRPCVLLSTLPGEPHGLGLLIAEALLTLEGCRCISLGVQTPVWDLSLAATAYGADIVTLGFSGAIGPNQVVDALTELRGRLPPTMQLWAGGAVPVLHRRRIAGVEPLASFEQLGAQVQDWRASHARIR